jgi:type III restriction enzyme
LLDNIQQVQRGQNLPVSDTLVKNKVARVNLDVEMETGTGKTYCYIKTIFELNRRYGWSKFIIVVPSIAIREGVAKSLEITAEHFLETYQKKARFFIYNSKQLHHLESFSSDAGINVMVINVQAFAARGADNRRIYEVLDDFQSRRPIDVISANRPILILDEPQKMEGAQTLKSWRSSRP